ncbi:hypothetical protein ACLKA7_001041 [Drosophila subpalustris]
MAWGGGGRGGGDNNSDDESVCGKRSRSSSLSLDEYTDSDDTATNIDEDENRSVVWLETEEYEKLLAELKELRARAAADETVKKTKSVQDQLSTLGINATVKTLVGNRFAALDEDTNNNDVDFPALEKQKKPKKAAKSKATPQLVKETEQMDVDQQKTTKKSRDIKSPTPTKPIKETNTGTSQPKSSSSSKTSKKKDIPIIATYNVNPKELTVGISHSITLPTKTETVKLFITGFWNNLALLFTQQENLVVPITTILICHPQ